MKKISFYKLSTKYKSHVFSSGKWIDGILMKELENKLKDYLGVKYVILTNSGTSSLLAAYWALKDEFKSLFVDPYTFPATYQPASILEYKINFVRTILEGKARLSKNGLNVITHLFGQPNNLVSNVGNNFIEDACQSFGAEFQGKKVGTFGKIGCFSFYPTKSFHTCGHGGAVVTNDEKYYHLMRVFIESGRDNGKMTELSALNLRMDEIKAEYLLNEFECYEQNTALQRTIAKEFIEAIPTPQPFLYELKNQKHIYSIFNMIIDNRDDFRKYMQDRGIETIVYYDSDILPKKEQLRYTDITSRIVAIPCRWNLTGIEIKRIKIALKEWFK